ncbi:MAG TPA: FAD-binding oxidoreductase [Terriglobales bacterium]|nr:FAD-binding oxidoreductase [Terriglobales bacterium]
MPAASGVMTQVSWPELAEIVGKEHLRASTAGDAIDGVQPQMIAEPGTAEDLARALRWAHAAGVKVAPRGGGTKLGWGNPPAACDLVLSTARLNRVLEHAWADMTVIVEAGCLVADLQKTLAEHGQRLALDPLWPERATIGGILSTNDSGSLRARYGSLRDLIIGITVALPDGTLAKSGGKVVKNVAGYDLAKLFTGALGTLGVIVQAIFRLHPLPRETRSLSFTGTPQALNQLLLAIQGSKLTFTGLQLRAEKGSAQLDVRFDGTSAGIEAQVKQVQQIAGSVAASDAPANTWTSHQAIWDGAAPALVAKFSVLPAQFAAVCALAERSAGAQSLAWKLVVQSVGTGYVRLEGAEPALRTALLTLRDELANMEGTLAALGCPMAVKRGVDVWGSPSDAQSLMVRIKQRFDPDGTLNPGRFIGGI